MVDEKLTAHLAELSKIGFDSDELAAMTADMKDIIALMDKVCDIDTDTVPYTLPAVSYSDLRCDEEKDSYPNSEILKNAAVKKDDSFVVPKVV